jgi:hypothetical protein
VTSDAAVTAPLDNGSMKVTYASSAQPGSAYEIEADRYGNYTIRAQGKVVKRVTALTDYLGKSRWGSKTLEQNAIEDAKRAIDAFGAPTH